MAGHTLLGYVLAVGIRGAARGEQLTAALWALVLWVVLRRAEQRHAGSALGASREEGSCSQIVRPHG